MGCKRNGCYITRFGICILISQQNPCAALAPMIRTCINNPSCIWICIWIQLRIWICIWINIPSINDNFAQLHHIASLLTSSQTYLEHCIHSWITTLFMRVGVSISGRLRRRLPPSVIWMALQTSSTWNCRGMHHSTPLIAKQAVRVANAGFTLHGHIILIPATARTITFFLCSAYVSELPLYWKRI